MSVSTSSAGSTINNCIPPDPCGIPGAPSLGPISPPQSPPSIHQCGPSCPFYGRPGHDGYSSSSSSCR
jgi:hypothetical protein